MVLFLVLKSIFIWQYIPFSFLLHSACMTDLFHPFTFYPSVILYLKCFIISLCGSYCIVQTHNLFSICFFCSLLFKNWIFLWLCFVSTIGLLVDTLKNIYSECSKVYSIMCHISQPPNITVSLHVKFKQLVPLPLYLLFYFLFCGCHAFYFCIQSCYYFCFRLSIYL